MNHESYLSGPLEWPPEVPLSRLPMASRWWGWLVQQGAWLLFQQLHSSFPFPPSSSMSGHQVSPHSVIHFYSATKYAVTALTEGLRQELREAQTHIRATVRVQPGPGGDRVGTGPPHPTRTLSRLCCQECEGHRAPGLSCCLRAPAWSLTLRWEGADQKGTQWVRLRESKECGKAWLEAWALGSFLEAA